MQKDGVDRHFFLLKIPFYEKGHQFVDRTSLLGMTSFICNKYRSDLRSTPGIRVSGSPRNKDRQVQAPASLWSWAVLSTMKNILEIKNTFMAYISLPTNNLAVCP